MDFLLLYVDPGSGSLIIQAVIAAVVAIPFFFRTQLSRIARAVRRGDRTEVERPAPHDGGG